MPTGASFLAKVARRLPSRQTRFDSLAPATLGTSPAGVFGGSAASVVNVWSGRGVVPNALVATTR